jgi:hypothetical protein
MAFYCGHINFTGVILEKEAVKNLDYKTKIYSDGGMVAFNNCRLHTRYQQNGGTLWIDGCFISCLYCEDAVVRFQNNASTFMSGNMFPNYILQPDGSYTAESTDSYYRFSMQGGSGSVHTALHFLGGDHRLMRFVDTFFSYRAKSDLYIWDKDVIKNNRKYDLASDNAILWFSAQTWNSIPKKSVTDTILMGGESRMLSGTIKPMNGDGTISQ